MNKSSYNLSFIGGGLLQGESVLVAEKFCSLNDWSEVDSYVLAHNLLQSRTVSTSKRFYSAIKARLASLTIEELQYLVSADEVEQRQLLWIAICRKYAFIRNFAEQVLVEKYRSFKLELDFETYEAFFFQECSTHPELESISESTRYKVRQILYKIMREAGLLDKKNKIIPALVSREIEELVGDNDLAIFPPI